MQIEASGGTGARSRRLAAVLLAAATLAACDEVGGKTEQAAPPPVAVSVVTVTSETQPIVNELPGRIAPTRVAEVRPRVSGVLVERVFEQGGMVRQGDVLYRIDPAPFRVRVDSASATLRRAEATRLLARQQSDRQAQLRERSITSIQNYDNAVAALAQADADVAAAKAGLDAARLDLDYTEVRAPIGGRIGRAEITEGALVTVGAGEPLARIQQLDPVYADVTQSAGALMTLRRAAAASGAGANADAPAELRFDDGSTYERRGRLLFSEATVDASTGQVILRGEFPNPEGELLPGLYVRVRIVQGAQANAISVPEQAVQRDAGGRAQLYVVEPDGKAKLRTVEAGRVFDGRWSIVGGLAAGERVVVEGFQQLRPDSAVDARPWDGAGVPSAPAAAN